MTQMFDPPQKKMVSLMILERVFLSFWRLIYKSQWRFSCSLIAFGTQNLAAFPTVDGRNPANHQGWWFLPLFIGFQPSQVVQDFFHQQYHIYLSTSTLMWDILDRSWKWLKPHAWNKNANPTTKYQHKSYSNSEFWCIKKHFILQTKHISNMCVAACALP